MKKWNGSSWTNLNVKKWNGSSWVSASAKKWNGSSWTNVGASLKTVKVNSSWSTVYDKSNNKRTGLGTNLQQGQYKGDTVNGINKSLVGFSLTSYKGKDISGIRLYLRAIDFYNVNGGTVHIGWHNHSTSPSLFTHSKYSGVTQKYEAKFEDRWITMPTAFVEGVKDGTVKGISIFYNTADVSGYARLHGHGGANPPVLEISYND